MLIVGPLISKVLSCQYIVARKVPEWSVTVVERRRPTKKRKVVFVMKHGRRGWLSWRCPGLEMRRYSSLTTLSQAIASKSSLRIDTSVPWGQFVWSYIKIIDLYGTLEHSFWRPRLRKSTRAAIGSTLHRSHTARNISRENSCLVGVECSVNFVQDGLPYLLADDWANEMLEFWDGRWMWVGYDGVWAIWIMA